MNKNGNILVGVFGALILAGLFVFGIQVSKLRSLPKVQNTFEIESSSSALSLKNSLVSVSGFTVDRQEDSSPKQVLRKVKSLSVDPSRTIELNDEIGGNASAAAIAIAILNARGNQPIYILLDSPGGSVVDGAKLISAMQTSKAPVYTVCTGLCASMAFMIHQYGTKRFATDRAILMSHPASASTAGDVDRMASFSNMIKRYTNKLEADIAKRMGLTFEQYKQKIQTNYWVDAEDAVKDNVVDQIVNLSLPISSGSQIEAGALLKQIKVGPSPDFDFIWIMPGYKRKEIK